MKQYAQVLCLTSLLFIVFTISGACASEKVDACVTYVNSGRNYHVEAIKTDGLELNSATHTYKYNSWSKYIVVFWEKEQASIIEIDGLFYWSTAMPLNGKDQEGRPWKVSSYSAWNCLGN